MKARGRRFETAAFGAFLGVIAYTLQPWVWSGLFIVLLLGGIGAPLGFRKINGDLRPVGGSLCGAARPAAACLFQGELAELVGRYRKHGS